MGDVFEGTPENIAKVRRSYERKIGFSKSSHTPIWNGEFGPVYATELVDGPEWESINAKRYAALREQLKVYKEDGIAWSIWLYKDIGIQGLVHAKEGSRWHQVFGESIKRKRAHALEFWGTDE
jgi:endoglucanase